MTNVDISTTTVFTYIYNSVTLKVQGTGWKKAGMTTSGKENNIDKFAYSVSQNNGKYELNKIEIN
jgi:hypothetical protein